MRTLTVMGSLVVAAILFSSGAWAQEQPQGTQSPSPATPAEPVAPLTGGNGNQPVPNDAGLTETDGQSGVSAQPQPDTHVLASVETFTVGSLSGLPHVFDPALFFSEFDETGLVAGRPYAVSNLGGSLNVQQYWEHYHIALTYNGAETIYRPSLFGLPNLPYQNASISQEILLGRWALRLRDNAQLSWGSGFGGLFAGGPGQLGQFSALGNIQPTLDAIGTIQTALARQVSNTVAGEADYSLSHRATLTFVGTYGLLHFSSPGYIDNQFMDGRIGYNYALSPANSMSLSYDYILNGFGGASNRTQSDSVQMGFGRKVTGRLAFQLQGGPQLVRFHDFGSSATQQLSWTASTALTYSFAHTSYSLSYSHFVTGGSGVFFGSRSDTITGMASHAFTRYWSGMLNGGYALNKSLVATGDFTNRFDNWFAGASLSRQIGPQVHLSLIYAFQSQTSGGGVCPVLSCGFPGSLVFRQFGATVQWHPLARAR